MSLLYHREGNADTVHAQQDAKKKGEAGEGRGGELIERVGTGKRVSWGG